MSEERFYDQVRKTMGNYAPEVPQHVYGKMRRALWWSNFTKMSATRFNMWYAVLILGAGSGAVALTVGNSCDASAAISTGVQPVIVTSVENPHTAIAKGCDSNASMSCDRKNVARNTATQPVTSATETTTAANQSNRGSVPASPSDLVSTPNVAEIPSTPSAIEATSETQTVSVKDPKKAGRTLKPKILVDHKSKDNGEK